MALGLKAAGDQVAVLASIDTADRLGRINRLRRKLPPWHAFPVDHGMGYAVYRGWEPAHGLAEVARRFRPDVVVIQAGEPIPIARAAMALDIPTVIHLRDVEFQHLGGDPRQLDGVSYIANSAFTAARFEETFGIDATVVLNLIDPERYRVQPSAEKVVFINPHPWKGVDLALEVASKNPTIDFLFVESWRLSPKEATRIHHAISQLGNVTWLPRTLDMRKIYRQAAFVIVPSQCDEAWGRIVSEAQISGIPVIVSDRGGLPEATGPGGIMLPCDDVKAWTEAVEKLWRDPSLRHELGAAALEHARRAAIQPAKVCTAYRAALLAAQRRHDQLA